MLVASAATITLIIIFNYFYKNKHKWNSIILAVSIQFTKLFYIHNYVRHGYEIGLVRQMYV